MATQEKARVVELNGRRNGRNTRGGGECHLPGTEVTTRWEYITPEVAVQYLHKNTKNRRLMEAPVARLVADMKAGDWVTTHEGAAFDTEGVLIDFQHRFHAIAQSGVPQWVLVTRGLPAGAREVINRGKMRTLAHNLQILGYAATTRFVAVARAFYQGHRPAASRNWPGDVAMRRFIDEHLDAITFGATAMPQRVGTAQVAAALARAYLYHEAAQLERFARAMADDIPREEQMPGDKSARLLSRWLSSVSRSHHSGMARVLAYQKAQNAIRHYLDGSDLDKLYAVTDDLFPLPATDGSGEGSEGEAISLPKGRG